MGLMTKKLHNHLNRNRKDLRQNPTWLYGKSPRHSRNRRDIPQHNEGYILQTHNQHDPKWRNLEATLKSEMRKGYPLSLLFFNIVLET